MGPFLAAALMASYVLYGFDTAGAFAEETDDPAAALLGDSPGSHRRRRWQAACSFSSASSPSATRSARAWANRGRPAVSRQGCARVQARRIAPGRR